MNTQSNRFRIHTNGKMRSIVTASGEGGLFLDWVALTRFSDATPEACGPLLHIWESGALSPGDLNTVIEVGVAAGMDNELRKITITNQVGWAREIELTTYAEIALNHPMGDAGHPAFSKLFVQTSISSDSKVLLARRRPRGLNENWPWMAQTLIGDFHGLSWETNRATFMGRGRTPLDPVAMDTPGLLGCQTGNVLDPVMAWRVKISLNPNESKSLWLITAAAADEKAVMDLMGKSSTADAAQDLLDDANVSFDSKLTKLNIDPVNATRYENLAGIMLTGKSPHVVPSSLAGSDIVHRFPLSPEEIRIVATGSADSAGTRDIFTALPFWKFLGLKVKVFVMDPALEKTAPEDVVFIDPSTFTPDQLSWWLASAQLVAGEDVTEASIPQAPARQRAKALAVENSVAHPDEPLEHFNGHGGFTTDGTEYVIPLDLKGGRLGLPPMPWVNVLANPNFGCIVTERGAGYTWSRNSQANRLTPWSNDPIRDPHGEAFYLRDDTTGEVWSPLPGPCNPTSSFVVSHGFGRTRFSSNSKGISQNVDFIVPPDDSIKLVSLRLRNESNKTREISFAAYQRLLLASSADRHHATLAWTDSDRVQHAVNPRAGDFTGGRVFSFIAAHGAGSASHVSNNSSAAFLGNGGVSSPESLVNDSAWKSERGFGRDACFSSRISLSLFPGEEVEIIVGFGEAMTEEEEDRLVRVYRKPGTLWSTTNRTTSYWEDMLGGLKIKTPLPEVDLMVNGWLLYQNLACRIWGRSAFYQSGGAYGFRDQLQDSGALASSHPDLMRSQILLHAAQQFSEGDVTHWWHPEPMGRGMRTKFSDDLLWLPYLTDHYLRTTGDSTVLEETRPFIEGPLLGDHEDEEYMKPAVSKESATVFEHCCLAIDKSLTKGAHGLPLIGIGDWNDGMSRIGREGRGESVWMGFFLFAILNQWIPRCEGRGQHERVAKYTAYRDELLTAINDAGWDGEWYRRAYYDDGTPLGTSSGDECRIDALAQAWAVISKAAPEERIMKSLDSLERELIDPEYDIIRLLYPPFVNTPHDPGYIKGYVAGVRENGGQYTHAACWVIRAMAEAGRRDEAAALLQHLSPVWHSRDADAVARYQVEPYVIAADIYGAEPHIGRGGWTWYTGSAGWMFRVAVESVLGLRVEDGDTLVLAPKVPDNWPRYSMNFRTPSGKTFHYIQIDIASGKSEEVIAFNVDGTDVAPTNGVARWPMLDDGNVHHVLITLGEAGKI